MTTLSTNVYHPPVPMPGWEHFRPKPFVRVSAFLNYLRCPRMFFYRYGCGLISKETRIAMVFGEAIHAAIGWMLRRGPDSLTKFEPWLDTVIGPDGETTMVETPTNAMTRFMKVWTPECEAMMDDKRNVANAQRILTQWALQHRGSNSIYIPVPPPEAVTGLRAKDTQSDMELPFAIDLGLPYLLAGRIDGLARHRSTGELWTLEFKTAGRVDSILLNAVEFNPQMLCYVLACRSWGLPITGTMFEFLETKAPLKTRESAPLIQVQPTYVQAHTTDEWLEYLRYKFMEMMAFVERQNFPKDYSGCNQYGTFGMAGFNCEYKMLCQPADWTKNRQFYDIKEDEVFEMPKEGAYTLPQYKLETGGKALKPEPIYIRTGDGPFLTNEFQSCRQPINKGGTAIELQGDYKGAS